MDNAHNSRLICFFYPWQCVSNSTDLDTILHEVHSVTDRMVGETAEEYSDRVWYTANAELARRKRIKRLYGTVQLKRVSPLVRFLRGY
jgi:hypothetical protein